MNRFDYLSYNYEGVGRECQWDTVKDTSKSTMLTTENNTTFWPNLLATTSAENISNGIA